MHYLRISLWSIIALIFIGCSSGGGNPAGPSVQSEYAVIDAGLELGKVGALAKRSSIDLQSLHIVLYSDKGDTVRDSASVSGSNVVNVLRQYRVLSHRRWSISAKSYDTNDSLIHSGKSGSVYVDSDDTLRLALSLSSRVSMYQANFVSIPTFVRPSANGNAQIPITADRVLLKVGGKTRAESSGSYQGGSVALAFDYIPSGPQTVVLEVHGSAAGYTGLLWSGSVAFNNAAGTDETKAVTLGWEGPAGMNGNATVVLGRVGKNTIDASMAGAD